MTLNERKMPERKAFFILLILTAIFFALFYAMEVYAETSDSEITEFFEKNYDIFTNNTIVIAALRTVGWGITKGLVWAAQGAETLYDTAFGFIDFTAWGRVNTLTAAFKPVFVALMAVSLFALGIMAILNHDKKPKIVINICIACLCFTSSTVVFQEFNSLAMSFKEGVESIGMKTRVESEVYRVVDESMVDLVYLKDKYNGFDNLNYKRNGSSYTGPGINKDNIRYLDFNEVLNPKSDQYNWNAKEKDILNKKIYVASPSKNGVADVLTGFGWNSADDADFCNEFYYRYTFFFFNAWTKIIAFLIIYLCMAYKCTRIAYELVIARLFASLYSAELSGGEKIAKILVFIRDSYVLLLTTTLCIKVYGLFNLFISDIVDNGFAEGIFAIFAAFCVIDGPNLVEKLLGMDVGLSSSTSRMMAAYGMVKGAASVAMAPASLAGSFAMQSYQQNRFLDKMQGGTSSNFSGQNSNNEGSFGSEGRGNTNNTEFSNSNNNRSNDRSDAYSSNNNNNMANYNSKMSEFDKSISSSEKVSAGSVSSESKTAEDMSKHDAAIPPAFRDSDVSSAGKGDSFSESARETSTASAFEPDLSSTGKREDFMESHMSYKDGLNSSSTGFNTSFMRESKQEQRSSFSIRETKSNSDFLNSGRKDKDI